MSAVGKILLLNNKYVIEGVHQHVEYCYLSRKIIHGDSVLYSRNSAGNIVMEEIIHRRPNITIGIVTEYSDGYHYFYCPEHSRVFNPYVENSQIILHPGTMVLLYITIDTVSILEIYDHSSIRKHDAKMITQIYKSQANNTEYVVQAYQTPSHLYDRPFTDLTHLNTFNIDPASSLDFDDAISFDSERRRVYVHIVDAHEQVPMGSTADIEGYKKAFTLYLNEHVENMLPIEMANYELSLIAGNARKVVTVEFAVNEKYEVVGSWVYKSAIVVKNRYNYEDFYKVSEETWDLDFLMAFCRKHLRPTLAIPHVKMDISGNGNISGFHYEFNNTGSHKLVETLMIMANVYISEKVGANIPQRYHSILHTGNEIHYNTGNPIVDNILTIKKYRNAYYDAQLAGHYGLGLEKYTHFTSPIRRYFDIIVHRILGGVRYGNIDAVLDNINWQETRLDKLGKIYHLLKILSYLDDHKNVGYVGWVVKCVNNGVVVLMDGLLQEIFVFDSRGYEVGDKVMLRIKYINWVTLGIHAYIADE